MNKQSKILTLQNLYQFFVEQNKTINFSSKDSGKPIVVTTNGVFETNEDDIPGMLKLKLKVCHTELNRNGSFISKENMEKAMPSLKYRPILAYIHTLPNGDEDFYAHNIEISEDKDGEEKITYLERQVGCFTADEPRLEYDKEMDKTYVIAYAVIPEEYTSAADIIRRKNGTKVSCELVINELSYNAKEKYLDLTDFYFGGTSLLGCDENGNEISEGMVGARADISDFCHKEPTYVFQDKMIELLDKFEKTLSNFNKDSREKGCDKMNKFEELLKQYNVTAADVTFETEGLSDEELEAKFAEVFDEKDSAIEEDEACGKKKCSEEDNKDEESENKNEEPIATEEEAYKKKKKCSVDSDGNMSISFEISHEDIRGALYNLISIYEDEDNEWYFVSNVYDDYFIFENWDGNKLYKQFYTIDDDNVSLDGERQEVFKMILTESEKLAIEKLRNDYAALEAKYNELAQFKANIEAAELKSKKDAIFAKSEYSILADDEAFKILISNAEKFTVEEIEEKTKAIFADHVIKAGTFSANNGSIDKPKSIGVNIIDKSNKKRQAYGGLFD